MCSTPLPYKHNGKHWLIGRLKLLKDFPGCPKGRYFIQDAAGDWFHSRTDKEVKDGKMKHYLFNKQYVLDNPTWFKEVKPITLK